MRILISIILVFISSLLFSQTYYSENTDIKDGLTNNAIRALFKDSRGYIWIGTDGGVSRWDGTTFINYNTLNGLAGNKVWSINEDEFGNLWFGCFGAGISKFDGQAFSTYDKENGLVDNSVRIIKYSKQFSALLIGTNESISILKDSIFHNFNTKNKSLKKDVIITGIKEDTNSALFIDFSGDHYGLTLNNKGKFELKLIANRWYNPEGLCSMFTNLDGDTIVGVGRTGIMAKDAYGINLHKRIGQVFSISEDDANKKYLASWNGSGIAPTGGFFSYEKGLIRSLNKDYNFKSIKGWSTLYFDQQNVLLYGTLDDGIYKLPPPYFEYFDEKYFNETYINAKEIEIDKNNTKWFITDSLLIKWDTNTLIKTDLVKYNDVKIQYYSKKIDPSNKLVISDINVDTKIKDYSRFGNIDLDNDDNIWVTLSGIGFFKIVKSNSWPIYHTTPMSDFVFSEADTLFMANAWLNKNMKFLNYHKSNDFVFINDSITPVFSHKILNYKNEIWTLSRISGVFLYENGYQRVICNEDSTINKIVNDVCFDTEGYAYLGGNDGRIEILAPGSRKKAFEISDKNLKNSVYWLRIANGFLFVGYSDGLRVYNFQDLKKKIVNYQYFGVEHGYKNIIVNEAAVDNNGDIFLATAHGIIKIKTHLFSEYRPSALKTIIEKVELFNKPTNWEDFGLINKWSALPIQVPRLEPEENHISFYFNTLNYIDDGDEYYYKLDGVDDSWMGPSRKDYIVYPFLNPGHYTFMLKSKNLSSQLYSDIAEFDFIILKPWYKQLWFTILVIFLIILILFIAYKFRINDLQKKENEKREIMRNISDLETKALQAQMNPHFLFNSINSIQNYILDNDIDGALVYLNSFSRVIRMTLEFVDHKFISLSDELEYLEHYVKLENMRFDNLFDYELLIDKQIDIETTLVPPMLLQTIIENSIKHGLRLLNSKGHIKLEFVHINEKTFKCIIEDNGVGREESKLSAKQFDHKKESKGLRIINERFNILNKDQSGIYGIEIIDLYSSNNKAIGTRVEIKFPYIFYSD